MSCETQLLVTLQDLLSIRDRGTQIDLAIFDFSKAFDTVPHERLLGKLEYYGIQGPILNWTAAFLRGRVQRVVLDSIASDHTTVDSGVHHGTVLGLLLFLIHINDLLRLFADDCLLYRPINRREDQLALQKDLHTLQLGVTHGAWDSTLINVISRVSLIRRHPLPNFILWRASFFMQSLIVNA